MLGGINDDALTYDEWVSASSKRLRRRLSPDVRLICAQWICGACALMCDTLAIAIAILAPPLPGLRAQLWLVAGICLLATVGLCGALLLLSSLPGNVLGELFDRTPKNEEETSND